MGPSADRRSLRAATLERAAIDAFRRAGWTVVPQPRGAELRPDLLVRRGDHQYVVDIKSAPEARRDRVIPLLSQAILYARAAAAHATIAPRPRPLAIIGAPRLSPSLIDALRSFAAQVAPDVAIGLLDLEGSRVFVGPALEALNAAVHARRPAPVPPLAPRLHLFSDLNQWMLKVLLSPGLPDHLVHAPHRPLANPSALAKAAGVSLMSAFRCVRLLRAGGFLDESASVLRLVDVEGLLERWRAANLKPVREVPVHWMLPGDPDRQLTDAVRVYRQQGASAGSRARGVPRAMPRPRICLGLFAAADALGFGFVRGVAPHLYVERFDPRALESLGLAPARANQPADVIVRVPSFRESVFRAAVVRHELPVCDVLQVWLDVADHPSRGASQAKEIWRRVLVPLWKHASP
jgi:hypothetical protein